MSWKPKTKVIVPIDFSDSAAAAIQAAIDAAESADCVHVVHVILDLEPVAPYGYWAVEDLPTREQHAVQHLGQFLKDNNFEGVRPVVLTGDPGRAITHYADEQAADLIVIPSHGYHGFKRLLLGSTAERVIRHAHCDVLVLRRKDAE